MEYLAYVLLAIVVGQQVYWSRVTNKLVDKLMCRNYAEYVQLTKPAPILPKALEDYSAIEEEKSILSELNGMIKT